MDDEKEEKEPVSTETGEEKIIEAEYKDIPADKEPVSIESDDIPPILAEPAPHPAQPENVPVAKESAVAYQDKFVEALEGLGPNSRASIIVNRYPDRPNQEFKVPNYTYEHKLTFPRVDEDGYEIYELIRGKIGGGDYQLVVRPKGEGFRANMNFDVTLGDPISPSEMQLSLLQTPPNATEQDRTSGGSPSFGGKPPNMFQELKTFITQAREINALVSPPATAQNTNTAPGVYVPIEDRLLEKMADNGHIDDVIDIVKHKMGVGQDKPSTWLDLAADIYYKPETLRAFTDVGRDLVGDIGSMFFLAKNGTGDVKPGGGLDQFRQTATTENPERPAEAPADTAKNSDADPSDGVIPKVEW